MSHTRPIILTSSDVPSCSSCASCAAQGCPVRSANGASTPLAITRRAFAGSAAGAVASLAAVGIGAAQSTSTDQAAGASASTPAVCTTLTPELTEGPYYIEDALLRDDITEGQAGVPFTLAMTVIDSTTCEPLPDVAVDIWHCDAGGTYSGIAAASNGEDTTGQTFLRGIQLTGQDGVATIKTIYPGWYVGRATHIHVKVHVGGAQADGTYAGGTVAHTGQLFFDDDVTDQIALIDPYVQHTQPRTRNDEDNIFGGGYESPGFMVTLTPVNADDLSQGMNGAVTMIVDPTAISTEMGRPRR